MLAGEPFFPEFGPNGAVMNAPHMTEEIREKIAQTDPRHAANWMPKPMKWLHLVVWLIAFAVMIPGALLRDREPVISLMLALVSFAILVVNAAWYAIVRTYLRRR